jgi:hypothetical protein
VNEAPRALVGGTKIASQPRTGQIDPPPPPPPPLPPSRFVFSEPGEGERGRKLQRLNMGREGDERDRGREGRRETGDGKAAAHPTRQVDRMCATPCRSIRDFVC